MPADVLEAIGGTRALYAFSRDGRGLFACGIALRGCGRRPTRETRRQRVGPGFSGTLREARLAGTSPPRKGLPVSTRLYAGNLPLSATAETLAGTFGRLGTVVSVTLDQNTVTGLSRRGAFVE